MALMKGIKLKAMRIIATEYFSVEEEAEDYLVREAYIKVDTITGDKNNITVSVGTYENSGGRLIYTKNYQFKPSVTDDAPNFIKQAYEYLKTLEDFTDAIDVLDDDVVQPETEEQPEEEQEEVEEDSEETEEESTEEPEVDLGELDEEDPEEVETPEETVE